LSQLAHTKTDLTSAQYFPNWNTSDFSRSLLPSDFAWILAAKVNAIVLSNPHYTVLTKFSLAENYAIRRSTRVFFPTVLLLKPIHVSSHPRHET
jgi:hypothetical protein